jgi:hypothetical protein
VGDTGVVQLGLEQSQLHNFSGITAAVGVWIIPDRRGGRNLRRYPRSGQGNR